MSMMPLNMIHPHCPVISRLWSSANMIETTPSMTKKAISTKVSESMALTGAQISSTPTTMPRSADSSDHQKPGAVRIHSVPTRPTTPLSRNSQPNRIVTASVARTGSTIAVAPRTSSTTPSTRNITQ